MNDAPLTAWALELIYKLVFHTTRAILAPLVQNSELYWHFLLATLIIGWAAWRFNPAIPHPGPWLGLGEFRRKYLSSAIWWHPSARVDYRYYLVNAIVTPVVFGTIVLNEPRVSAWLGSLLGAGAGGETQASLLTRLIFTLLFFVAYDFGRFLSHSLLHDIPWLWEFHKVHHSAQVLTPFTSFRVHPIDLAVMALFPALFTGLLSWGFHRFIDPGVSVFTFMGLHALLWLSYVVGNLRHTHVWFTYGPHLKEWLISPAHHQLHHSAEPRHWGCNRGSDLAIWDRLYGTLITPSEAPEAFTMGLGDGTDGQWHKVSRLYVWPFYQGPAAKAQTAPGPSPDSGP